MFKINETVYFSARPVTFLGTVAGKRNKVLALCRRADGTEFKTGMMMLSGAPEFAAPGPVFVRPGEGVYRLKSR